MAGGFRLVGAGHPIVPVMIGGRPACHPNGVAARIARHLRDGVLLSGRAAGRIRIRTDVGGAGRKDLDRAIEAFTTVGRELGVPA